MDWGRTSPWKMNISSECWSVVFFTWRKERKEREATRKGTIRRPFPCFHLSNKNRIIPDIPINGSENYLLTPLLNQNHHVSLAQDHSLSLLSLQNSSNKVFSGRKGRSHSCPVMQCFHSGKRMGGLLHSSFDTEKLFAPSNLDYLVPLRHLHVKTGEDHRLPQTSSQILRLCT